MDRANTMTDELDAASALTQRVYALLIEAPSTRHRLETLRPDAGAEPSQAQALLAESQ
jgi:hypothetical protein